jgi:uncharacterized membrane protein YoaK (UPF0700 family)
MMTFLFFSTGAFISALLFPKIGYKVFFIVLFISLFMTGISILDSKKRRKDNDSDLIAVN